ncbi:MAG TPA: uroporphyrinogen decarboxylase family protein [Phycisphaerae bacterium]|nr:uroporphyrinogen decarboxylase family protein [Phycisphaerae bacterium]
MTRRERLTATLRGEPVDRPPISFYEIGGWTPDLDDPDPFNIYNDPSWRPLLQLAEEKTDLIRMRGASWSVRRVGGTPRDEFSKTETWMQNGARFTRTTLTVGGRTMTQVTRQDPDVSTTWTIEHLLKTPEDLKAYLELPDPDGRIEVDVAKLVVEEKELGDRGIIMIDCGDPICSASLFSMEDYLVIALTEPKLFHRLLEKEARPIYEATEAVAKAFPGHLWRVCGSEYACEPFLPPRLFEEYVVRYTGPMVKIIQKYGGYARIHCHGRIRSALPYLIQMGADGTDPIEPPPQGNVELIEVRRNYGKQLVLFGNLEASDIENLEPPQFEKKVAKALIEGTAGQGRGFVLHPSACPYGRTISARTMANYETIVRLATRFQG